MEISAWATRCYVMTPHQKRRFPARVDFCTSAGFLGGSGERKAYGLRGSGPQAVVTDLGIMEPDANGELMLTALQPGKTVEAARQNTGWDLKCREEIRITPAPSAEELHILRTELDPEGIYLRG